MEIPARSARSRAANSLSDGGTRPRAVQLDYIRFPCTFGVQESCREATGMGWVVAVVSSRPCIDLDHAARRHHHVTSVVDAISNPVAQNPGAIFRPLLSRYAWARVFEPVPGRVNSFEQLPLTATSPVATNKRNPDRRSNRMKSSGGRNLTSQEPSLSQV